jgi:murein DD-endopeptidase MepM/ murein hydrolase activator NlpD
MINLETLKKEVYKKERKGLIFKIFSFNLIVMVIISLSLSSSVVTEREKELLTMNRELAYERDSLKNLVINDLMLLKEQENKLIRQSLSISEDTSYNSIIPTTNNLYSYTKDQVNKFNKIENLIESKWDSIYKIPSGLPITSVDFKNLSDKYGYRKHPIFKRWIFHEGVDISAKKGSKIYSTADGIVEKVIISSRGYGNRIVIDHGNGYKTLYAHLKGFSVKKGQSIKRNDVIGYVGNTGRSTGPHLHYEVLLNNRPVDPSHYFYLGDEILASK